MPPKASPPQIPPKPSGLSRLFGGLYGAFLGLTLLKFGNPPVMESWVTTPKDVYQFIIDRPWPIAWAYTALALLLILGLVSARGRLPAWRSVQHRWILVLPLVWLGWTLFSALSTIDSTLSSLVCYHFIAAIACFFMGFALLPSVGSLRPFWTGLLVAFALVLGSGLMQHFGGLEQTRRHFFLYIYPTLDSVAPEYLKKMSSDRIFGTLFYPNTLAGALILLLPPLLWFLWTLREHFTIGARGFLLCALALGSAACLFWSGSKGGWLLVLLLVLIALLFSPVHIKIKALTLAVCLLVGSAGFIYRYAGFFRKGATSVAARFDYWRAAVQIAKENPLDGTGPGTFGKSYFRIKSPESEPTRLTHNDYLQQASDSGIPALVAYLTFISSALWLSRPRGILTLNDLVTEPSERVMRLCAWLGLLGWSLQSFIEFCLYIPALAWPAFTILGWLLSHATRPVDRQTA